MRLRRPLPSEISMLRGIANYQFGYPAGEVLISNDVIVGVSPNTGRIREVYEPGKGLILVLRAHDYRYSLTLSAASRLLRSFTPPRLRAIVDINKVLYKSILCRAILDIDPLLMPGDEVIVVSESDELIGVGRLRFSPLEVKEPWCMGEAIRVRHWVEREERNEGV